VVGVSEITKDVLSRRTQDYQRWVEAFAAHHVIPIAWAEKGVRKQDDLRPYLRQMDKQRRYGVISFSRAWNRERPFAPLRPSIRLPILITASWYKLHLTR
jgi:hypothetical protein